MHNAYWRVDIDLVDGAKNNAMVMAHKEDPRGLLAEDEELPFNSGLEGGIDWEDGATPTRNEPGDRPETGAVPDLASPRRQARPQDP